MHQRFNRSHPAEGVFVFRGQPTIVFLTVCSRKRKPVLDNPIVHAALIDSWLEASSWLIGSYSIMPDHIHLFCAPSAENHEIETWVTFWKRCLRRRLKTNEPLFQAHSFHHRLRQNESYSEKWDYVRMNPVRAGLVADPDHWPYQGVLNELDWCGSAERRPTNRSGSAKSW